MEQNGRPEQTGLTHPSPHCSRCGGLMLLDYYMDMQDDTGQIDIEALRCTGCGEVIDQVILKNRLQTLPNLLYGTRRRKFAQRMDENPPRQSPDAQNQEPSSGE